MTGRIDKRLAELGIAPSEPPAPVGAYVPAIRTGNLVFTAGQLPLLEGKLVAVGKVPGDVGLDDARRAARQAAINAIAALGSVVESLDAVRRIVRLNVFVNSSAGFGQQAAVADGASELLAEVFGQVGRHTRCAVGVAELPLNSPVEIDLTAEVK